LFASLLPNPLLHYFAAVFLEQDKSRKITHAGIKKILEEEYDRKKSPHNLELSVRKMLVFGSKSLDELEKVVHMLAMHSFSGMKRRGLGATKKRLPEKESALEAVDDDSASAEGEKKKKKKKDEPKPKYFAQGILMSEFPFCLCLD
jgi:hypothetical protein